MERAGAFLDTERKLEEFVANSDVRKWILDRCDDVDRMEGQPLEKLGRSPSQWIGAPEVRDELEDMIGLKTSSNCDRADEQRFDEPAFIEPQQVAVNRAVAEHEQDAVGTGQALIEIQLGGTNDRVVGVRHLDMVH